MPRAPLTITTQVNSANSFGAGATLRPNQFGNAPRSVIRLPYQNSTDLGIFKNFDAGSRVALQFRVEMFNVFNRTSFTNAGRVLGNPTFGRLTTAAEPRLIQLGFRMTL